MSREKGTLVRQLIERARADADDAEIEEVLALCDPQCEMTSLLAGIERQTYRGHDGLRSYFGDMSDAWSEWSNEVEEVLDAGPDAVVVTFRCRLVGKDSGVVLEAQLGGVGVVSEGRLLRFRTYPSPAEAFEAVGLRE